MLNPASALFREGEHLLTEERGLTDRALYHSVLVAIADGATRQVDIAGRLGRAANTLVWPLGQLEETDFILKTQDPLRRQRPVYRARTSGLIRLLVFSAYGFTDELVKVAADRETSPSSTGQRCTTGDPERRRPRAVSTRLGTADGTSGVDAPPRGYRLGAIGDRTGAGVRARAWWWIAAALVVGLLAAGCSDEGEDAEGGEPADEAVTTDDLGTDDSSAAPSGEVDCSPEALGALEGYDFVTADLVEEGELGPTCLGEPDQTLADAWDVLASIVAPDDLADLGIFAGFDGGESSDEVTLAFVNRVAGDPEQFQMSINLTEAEADPDELTLTMVHEFGHVLTQLPDQLDLDVAPEECDTFYNGEGCFRSGSIMDEWIQAFWTPEQLAEVDPFEPSAADGEERCTLDDGFFGSYAASSPEEDFAEALSAFALGVPAETDGQQERYDLLDQYAQIADQQLNAEESGLGPLPNTFEICG